jgi:hypothetical protein
MNIICQSVEFCQCVCNGISRGVYMEARKRSKGSGLGILGKRLGYLEMLHCTNIETKMRE